MNERRFPISRPKNGKLDYHFPRHAELGALLKDRRATPRYEEIDPGNGEIPGGPGRWSVLTVLRST